MEALKEAMMTKKADAAAGRRNRIAWWKRLLWSLGAITGVVTTGVGTSGSPAAAQDVDYRSAAAAPAAWQEFAQRLQAHFQDRLATDEDVRLLQDYIATRRGGVSTTALALTVRAWVESDGEIQRIEFDGLDDDNLAVRLRALLSLGDVGVPPSDMLQPVRLRLSLRPTDQPGRGE
jgi:hypothetical protein